MKLLGQNKVCFLLLISTMIFFFSCKQTTSDKELLLRAENLLRIAPYKALSILDSIPHPEKMDKESYMQYILTQFNAKSKTGKDFTNDTLIFEAETFFENKKKYMEAAEAAICGGNLYFKKGHIDKALSQFLQAQVLSEQTENKKLAGRSHNNIGYLYFDQDVMDSAIIHYKQALSLYNEIENTKEHRLKTIANLARAYDADRNIDSSLYYSEKGLKLAKELNQKEFISGFYHLLGSVSREKGEYGKAKKYLKDALKETNTPSDSLRMYLSYTILYGKTSQLDSVDYYASSIKKRLSEITDDYVLRGIYSTFSSYLQQIGEYEKAIYYRNLSDKVEIQIEESLDPSKLFKADKKFYLELKAKKENERIPYLSFIIILCIVVAAALYFILKEYRHIQREDVKNKTMQQKMEEIKTEYNDLKNDIYKGFESQLSTDEKQHFLIEGDNQPIQNQIQDLINFLGTKHKQERVEWAKNYLQKHSFNIEIFKTLSDKEIYLLALCADKYTNNEISLDFRVSIEEVQRYKQTLKQHLEEVGLLSTDLKQILL